MKRIFKEYIIWRKVSLPAPAGFLRLRTRKIQVHNNGTWFSRQRLLVGLILTNLFWMASKQIDSREWSSGRTVSVERCRKTLARWSWGASNDSPKYYADRMNAQPSSNLKVDSKWSKFYDDEIYDESAIGAGRTPPPLTVRSLAGRSDLRTSYMRKPDFPLLCRNEWIILNNNE